MAPAKKSKPARKRYGKRFATPQRKVKSVSKLPQSEATAPTSPLKPEPPKLPTSRPDSFELIKILVVATISAIALHRNILPSECFDYLPFDTYNPDASAQTFLNGVENEDYHKHPDGPKNVLVARRGSHPHCDKLYSWINGINDAMEREYLKEFQLVFHTGVQDKIELLESYTFNFTYQFGVPAMQIDTERTQEGHTASRILSEVKEDASGFIADLRAWMFTLEELPAGLKMRMELKYNDNAPKSFHAINFKAYDALQPRFNAHTRTSKEVASIKTGHHNLAVDCVTTVATSQDSSDEASGGNAKQDTADSSDSSFDPTQRLIDEFHQQSTVKIMARSRRQASDSNSIQTVTQDTVLLPNDTQIQNGQASYEKQFDTIVGDNESNATDVRTNLTQEDIANQQTKARDFEATRHCECGNSDSGDMVMVCQCGRSFHPCCYGYLDQFPSSHKCYSCSVGNDHSIIEDMKELWFKRKVLYYMRGKKNPLDLQSLQRLCDYIGHDTPYVLSLLQDLAGEGYLKKDRSTFPIDCAYTYISTDRDLEESNYFHKMQNTDDLDAQHPISPTTRPITQSLGGSTTASECSDGAEISHTTPKSRFNFRHSPASMNESCVVEAGLKRTSEPLLNDAYRKRLRQTPPQSSASYFDTPVNTNKTPP